MVVREILQTPIFGVLKSSTKVEPVEPVTMNPDHCHVSWFHFRVALKIYI